MKKESSELGITISELMRQKINPISQMKKMEFLLLRIYEKVNDGRN